MPPSDHSGSPCDTEHDQNPACDEAAEKDTVEREDVYTMPAHHDGSRQL